MGWSAVVLIGRRHRAGGRVWRYGQFRGERRGHLSAGGRSVNRVARWDGSEWSDLGGGIAGEVRSLAAVDTAAFASDSRGLYVGGNITSAGGVAVRNFARWDGAWWSSVAGGLDNLPFALTPFEGRAGTGELDGPALFAGGAFTRAGDLSSTNRIARLHLCPGVACRADLDGDGQLTIFDFLEFQNLFASGDMRADFDGDGSLTIFDFLQFQNEFAQGCD